MQLELKETEYTRCIARSKDRCQLHPAAGEPSAAWRVAHMCWVMHCGHTHSLSHASRNQHRNETLVVETDRVGNHKVFGARYVEGVGAVRGGWPIEQRKRPTTAGHRERSEVRLRLQRHLASSVTALQP